eukprot:CAMPEP_0117077922 /NCGR_PEP_ID=MMETSP0472-20121206/54930_1 /TAXON_ID=693140 ORGANISM="Tiarina fusus, Strain LIS" /NCGR_SAMPLE_ID=MMETSP0472 /ASSEMBLY_ACC=CAM_ASM_000603 /LENGTH=161 /DNA_ID=CAMNT_0004804431 /DNA_START=206 /DNA_END=691 /DNA_ORIENTATION=+
MSSKDHLLKESKFLDKLYDAESMMLIKGSVASGFIVLLGGGDKRKGSTADLSLAFLALTQGNVLEACFGVANPSRREDTPASRAARDAKLMLDDCAATDAFRRGAVQAYCDAFQLVVIHQDQMGRLNCITRCFRAKKIRKKTERNLREAFMGLAKACSESR